MTVYEAHEEILYDGQHTCTFILTGPEAESSLTFKRPWLKKHKRSGTWLDMHNAPHTTQARLKM